MNAVPVTLALLVAVTASAASPPPPGMPPPGTYRQADVVTKKPLPVGSQLVIIAGKGGKTGFSINAIRALDSNQGFVAGLLAGPLPLTWSQTSSTTGNCRLKFEAVPHGITVTQDAGFGDCGFGYGVTASGMYLLEPEKPLKT
jgi:hypothetical protein